MTLPHRIEAAEGADRALDFAIAIAVDWKWPDWQDGEPRIKDYTSRKGLEAARANDLWNRDIPRYTASIDAALTLVPEGWRFHSADASVVGRCRIMLEGPKTKWAVDSDGYDCAGGDWYTQATAATPALALCAAAIKAHIERTTHD